MLHPATVEPAQPTASRSLGLQLHLVPCSLLAQCLTSSAIPYNLIHTAIPRHCFVRLMFERAITISSANIHSYHGSDLAVVHRTHQTAPVRQRIRNSYGLRRVNRFGRSIHMHHSRRIRTSSGEPQLRRHGSTMGSHCARLHRSVRLHCAAAAREDCVGGLLAYRRRAAPD